MIGLLICCGCGQTEDYPSRPITLVCPWAAGGGTDRVSRQMAMLLEREMGQPVSVINATGGKGVTGHSRGLNARPDGYTLTMATFELSTMHWAGLTDLSYQNCVPISVFNEDYAALFVRNDARWQSIGDLESEIQETPGKLTGSGTAVGGAWHLALAGWLSAAGIDVSAVNWVPSAGANPSLQQLMSGGVDLVCCSLPEARALLESDQIRALGVMAPERAQGFEQVKTFAEQGRDWTLGGWRGLAVPEGTPPAVVEQLVSSVEAIVNAEPKPGGFAEFMETQKFGLKYRDPGDTKLFLADTDRVMGELLSSEAMKAVNEDRFSPMTYPTILMGLIGVTLIVLCVSGLRLHRQATEPEDSVARSLTPSDGGYVNVALVLLSVTTYVVLADTVGFILMAGVILLGLLVRLGTRPLNSLVIVVVLVPALYFAFAQGLRVPLPRGWLG